MAKRPNFSATAMGSFSIRFGRGPGGLKNLSLLDVEGEGGRTERHLVPGRQARSVHAALVHLHTVGRSEVHDLPITRRASAKLSVTPRDVGVRKDAVGLARATDHRHRAVEHVTPVVDRDDRPGLYEPGRSAATPLLARLALGHAVDHRVALLAL